MACVVERLERHAARERAVADDGHDRLVGAPAVACGRQSESHRDRVAGVARVVYVVGALRALGEPAHAAVGPERVEPAPAPGEQLVHVRLMPHVPHDAVARTVERAVEADRQLDDAEVRGEVPAGLRDRLDERVTDLIGQGAQLPGVQVLQIAGAGDGVQDAVVIHGVAHSPAPLRAAVACRPESRC